MASGTMRQPPQPNRQLTLKATYEPGTDEHNLLYQTLERPLSRAKRSNTHQAPKPRERWQSAIFTVKKSLLGFQFEYSKLNKGEIRLLCLRHGEESDPLRATLFNRRLEDVVDGYEALSYPWGPPKDRTTHKIHLRDLNATLPNFNYRTVEEQFYMAVKTVQKKSRDTAFPIRKNLRQALLKLRSKVHDVNLWVDAICIDQTDRGKEEKEAQLSIMAKIYNSASNVCIWLGDSHEGASDALKLVRDIVNFKNFDNLISLPAAKDRWISLIELMNAPWFSRRWNIQEVAFSRNATIHCADDVVHWDDFADAVSLLTENIDVFKNNFREEIFDDLETNSACLLVRILTNICRKPGPHEGVSNLMDLETLVSTYRISKHLFPETLSTRFCHLPEILHAQKRTGNHCTRANWKEIIRTPSWWKK